MQPRGFNIELTQGHGTPVRLTEKTQEILRLKVFSIFFFPKTQLCYKILALQIKSRWRSLRRSIIRRPLIMKRILGFILAGVIAFSMAGCATSNIDEPKTALGGETGKAVGVSTAALSAKTSVPETLPEKAEPLYGVNVSKNTKATVDYSNITEGYLLVKYTGGKNTRIKVQIYLTDKNKYTYNLNNKGEFETFPLSEGDGKYTIKVFEQVEGTKYASVYTCTVEMKLRNDFLPFLYPNQNVNYLPGSNTVKKAVELVKNAKTTLDKTSAIYEFVVNALTYDYDRAKSVTDGTLVGYVPVLDDVLAAKKGICFDYASLMAGMLRSQNVPCMLVFGYAGNVYHAWIKVYVDGTGWVDIIQFDGKSWSMMDPTFISTGKNSDAAKKYVGNGNNYSEKTFY